MNIIELTEKLNNVADPRRQWGNKRHQLVDFLVIGFCTIVCGGEDFTDIETTGIEKEEWLGTFLALPNGIPDSDTFRLIFKMANP